MAVNTVATHVRRLVCRCSCTQENEHQLAALLESPQILCQHKNQHRTYIFFAYLKEKTGFTTPFTTELSTELHEKKFCMSSKFCMRSFMSSDKAAITTWYQQQTLYLLLNGNKKTSREKHA